MDLDERYRHFSGQGPDLRKSMVGRGSSITFGIDFICFYIFNCFVCFASEVYLCVHVSQIPGIPIFPSSLSCHDGV